MVEEFLFYVQLRTISTLSIVMYTSSQTLTGFLAAQTYENMPEAACSNANAICEKSYR
jgi:hypothetical protein